MSKVEGNKPPPARPSPIEPTGLPRHVAKPAALSPPVPAATPSPNPSAKEHLLRPFLGTRVVVTTLAGLVIEGQFDELRAGLIALSHCVVVGTQHRALGVDRLVLVMRDNLSHVNSVPTAVEPAP